MRVGAADALPYEAWVTHAAAGGSKDLRLYDLARIALPWTLDEGFESCLSIRRNRRDGSQRDYYLVLPQTGAGLAKLAGAVGLRWSVEECFQRAKEELGLDHCEARSWHSWASSHVSLHGRACLSGRALGAVLSRRWRQTDRKASARSRA